MSDSKIPFKGKKIPKHQERNTFLQQVADLTPEVLFVIDLEELEIIFVNKKAEQVLGYNAGFVCKKGYEIFKTVLHPEDFQLRMENLEYCRQLPDQEESEVEVRIKSADHNWNWFRIRDKVFKRNADGTVSQTIGIAQNIHEQKIADEKLKEEHRRFKDAQAIGHIGSFERNLPGDYVLCSEEFLRIHGLALQPCIIPTQQFFSCVHPDDQEAFLEAVNHTHATGEPLNMLNRIVRPDGSIRYVHRRSEMIKNSQGRPIRVYGTIQDVTEQAEAQQKIHESETLMRQAEIAGSFGSYKYHLSSKKLVVSDGFFKLFGLEPGGFEPSLEFIDSVSHPDDVLKVHQVLDQAQKDKKPYEYNRRIYLPNGQMRHINSRGKVVCDAAGNAQTLIGIAQDVTDLKRTEELLKENALFIRKVADTTPDILFVFDLEQMQLQYINRDMEPLTGKSQKILQSLNMEALLSLLHPDEREDALAFTQSFAEASDDEMKEVEFRVQNREGEWRWFHCRGRVFRRNKEGKVKQYLSIMRDITEEKNTTKALLEAEKLSVKGTMARTIAHEVRGPAANIALSMQFLQQELGDNLTEKGEAQVFFDIVNKSCNRITNYINDLLSISDTEKDTFKKSDLAELVEEVLSRAEDRIFLKGIEVERHFNTGYTVNANRERLQVALLNIVMNAVEAMEEQKGILQVFIREHNNEIHLSIQDNGCGMSQEQLSRMFEPYFTSKPDGMGIGLANVKSILQAHSAKIDVKSEPGRGTVFTVIFCK